MSTPLWARLVLHATRTTLKLHRAQEILRDELLFAYLPAPSRGAFTIESYEPEHSYLPGGAVFELGLFDWEKELLASPLLPRSGRVLLGAAGGGRELKGLFERGYSVSAFEPASALLAGALKVCAECPGSQVVCASFSDLWLLAEGGSSALAALDLNVDLVWLGWGSLSHLTGTGEPLRLLRALSSLLPGRPVVLSYIERSSEAAKGRGARRLRQALRGAFRRLGGAEVPEGLECHTLGGFYYTFTQNELSELAQQAGYRVALHKSESFPHAVLVPVLDS